MNFYNQDTFCGHFLAAFVFCSDEEKFPRRGGFPIAQKFIPASQSCPVTMKRSCEQKQEPQIVHRGKVNLGFIDLPRGDQWATNFTNI